MLLYVSQGTTLDRFLPWPGGGRSGSYLYFFELKVKVSKSTLGLVAPLPPGHFCTCLFLCSELFHLCATLIHNEMVSIATGSGQVARIFNQIIAAATVTESLVRVARIHDTSFKRGTPRVLPWPWLPNTLLLFPYCKLKVLPCVKSAHNRSTSNLVANCFVYDDTRVIKTSYAQFKP